MSQLSLVSFAFFAVCIALAVAAPQPEDKPSGGGGGFGIPAFPSIPGLNFPVDPSTMPMPSMPPMGPEALNLNTATNYTNYMPELVNYWTKQGGNIPVVGQMVSGGSGGPGKGL